MRNSFIVAIVLFTYFVLSGVTLVSGEAGQGIMGRLIMADIFMVGFAALTALSLRKLYFPKEYAIYLLFIVLFGIAGTRSYLPQQSAIELAVHLWAWLSSLVIFNVLALNAQKNLRIGLLLFLMSSATLGTLGLIQFFIFPDMLSGRAVGGLVGSFRNTGQSGAYFGMAMALIVPAMLSGLIKTNRYTLVMAIIVGIAFLFCLKRSSLIGFAIGYVGLLGLLLVYGNVRYKKYAFYLVVVSLIAMPIIYFMFQWGLENVKALQWRAEAKFRADTLEKFREGFFDENLSAAMAAFGDKPFLGVGLGNIAGIYTAKYEIHSTYIKILATGGIAGVIVYLAFLGTWTKSIISNINQRSQEAIFLLYFSPFLFGLITSWIYTYHLRKREFWIVYAFVVMISHIAQQREVARKQSRTIHVFDKDVSGMVAAE